LKKESVSVELMGLGIWGAFVTWLRRWNLLPLFFSFFSFWLYSISVTKFKAHTSILFPVKLW